MANDTQAVPEIPLEAATLSGDVRDFLLTHIRAMEDPWSKLSEKQQQDKIYAAENAAGHLLRQLIPVIAARGFPTLTVQVGKFTVDKGVKIETLASSTIDNIGSLASHGKGAALLILADAADYFGERALARPDPDQSEIFADAPSSDNPDAPPEEHIDRNGRNYYGRRHARYARGIEARA